MFAFLLTFLLQIFFKKYFCGNFLIKIVRPVLGAVSIKGLSEGYFRYGRGTRRDNGTWCRYVRLNFLGLIHFSFTSNFSLLLIVLVVCISIAFLLCSYFSVHFVMIYNSK